MARCPYYPIKCYLKKKDRTECPERCQKKSRINDNTEEIGIRKKIYTSFCK